ncbi:MAG: hypothetical protein ACAH21_19115 [Ramlibacter sp.]|nr:hypothetical protein [Ramlibacter sp.]
MRARLVFMLAALVVAVGFAALNWSEFNRTSPLSFGLFITEASIGMVMLGILGLTILAFLLSTAVHESRYVLESRRHMKSLEAQRDLADKAEASRLAELRQQFDTHIRESREHRQQLGLAATEADKALAQSQRELRLQFEQLGRMIAGRLTELETRMDTRLERFQAAQPPVVEVPLQDRVNARVNV